MSDNYFGSNDPSGWYSGDNTTYSQPQQGSPYPSYDQGGAGGYDWGGAPYGQQPQQQPPSRGYDSQQNNGAQSSQYYSGQMFMPNQQLGAQQSDDVSIEDEPPLLEELGINFEHIKLKTMAVLNPLNNASAEVISDQDLAGPLVFCLLFGSALLLHGKVHFGYIYGIGVLGCVGIYWLLNLMSLNGISLTCTVSVLGYCLLPMALLSFVGVAVSFKGLLGLPVAAMAVLWCSTSSSKLFVTALSMEHQRFLVAYPCLLLYGMFALLAVF